VNEAGGGGVCIVCDGATVDGCTVHVADSVINDNYAVGVCCTTKRGHLRLALCV
jgi:hypothetical protein